MKNKKTSQFTTPKVLTLMALLTILYIFFSILCLDGALSHSFETMLRYWQGRHFVTPLISALFFGFIQWILRTHKLQWIPLAIGMTGLFLADLLTIYFYEQGIWIIAYILLNVAEPLCFGTIAALMILWLHKQGNSTKWIVAVIFLVLLVACIWAWPHTLTDRVTVNFDGNVGFYNGDSISAEIQMTTEDFNDLIRRSKVYPCFKEQPWKGDRAIIIRLSEQYVLVAPRGDDACIYEYSGSFDGFDLTHPRWIIFSYTLNYDNLMQHTTGWTVQD